MNDKLVISNAILVFAVILIISVSIFISLKKFNSERLLLIAFGILFLISFSLLNGIIHTAGVKNFISFGWNFFILAATVSLTVFSPVLIPAIKFLRTNKIKTREKTPGIEENLPVGSEINKLPTQENKITPEELTEEINFFPEKSQFGITTEDENPIEKPEESKSTENTVINEPEEISAEELNISNKGVSKNADGKNSDNKIVNKTVIQKNIKKQTVSPKRKKGRKRK